MYPLKSQNVPQFGNSWAKNIPKFNAFRNFKCEFSLLSAEQL